MEKWKRIKRALRIKNTRPRVFLKKCNYFVNFTFVSNSVQLFLKKIEKPSFIFLSLDKRSVCCKKQIKHIFKFMNINNTVVNNLVKCIKSSDRASTERASRSVYGDARNRSGSREYRW